MAENTTIVAFEIGSSKIKGAVARLDSDNTLTIIASEENKLPEDTVRYGTVRKVQDVSDNILDITSRLEQNPAVAPGKIRGAYVSLGGFSLMSKPATVERNFQEETEITDTLIKQIKHQVDTAGVPDRDILSVMTRNFVVDSIAQKDPRGSYARNLKAGLTVLYSRPQLLGNLNRIFSEKFPLAINGTVLRPLAEAYLVLSDDERQLGCMLVDFGAETTTVSIYKDSSLCYLATIPMGSRNITRDLTALKCTERRAEEIKLMMADVDPDKASVADSVEGLDKTEINALVSARVGELISNISEQIDYAGLKPEDLASGIVVVGGGANLRGFISLLSRQTSMKVHKGIIPHGSVRIADYKSRNSDDIDIASILSVAARMPRKLCIEYPEPVDNNEPGDATKMAEIYTKQKDPHAIPPKKEREEEPKKQKTSPADSRRGGFFGKVWERAMEILNDEGAAFDDNNKENKEND